MMVERVGVVEVVGGGGEWMHGVERQVVIYIVWRIL